MHTVRPRLSAMDAMFVAPIAPPPVAGSEVQVPTQVNTPSPKRRRHGVKGPDPNLTPPAPAPPPPVLPTHPETGTIWHDVDEVSFENQAHRRKYRVVYNRFMSWWFRSRPVWEKVAGHPCSEELFNLGREDFQSLSTQQKNTLLRYMLHRTGAPSWVREFASKQWPMEDCEKKAKVVVSGMTFLLTYQGAWGILKPGTDLPSPLTDNQLTEHVRELPEAQALWQDSLTFAETLSTLFRAQSWCACLEICLKTFREQQELRVHLHVYLKSDNRMRCQDQKQLQFQNTLPHIRDSLWGRKVAKANWAGAYYCLAPKLGSVYSHGTACRFHDFPVDPQWIFNMIESEKMDYKSAKSELVKCGKGLVRRLADLECWKAKKDEILVEEMVEKASAVSRQHLQVFPRWPVVDAWLSEVTRPNLARKRCLVLHGPSRTGKTEFVRGLFPLGTVLELNCANVKDVCLDGFDCLRHRAILWDEASAALVSNNRKIFQHPLCTVDVGHSPTGAHVKRYFLGNACSVITTNKWCEDVAKLPLGDQRWLEANMVVFPVENPLWVNPCPVASCGEAFSALQI